jgi:hypothetical protein
VGSRAGLNAVVKRKFPDLDGTRTTYHPSRSPALYRYTTEIFRLFYVAYAVYKSLNKVTTISTQKTYACNRDLSYPSFQVIQDVILVTVELVLLFVDSLCLTKHHAMKMYWGSGDIAPRMLDLGTRWR